MSPIPKLGRHQRGISLLVVLVLLLIMTLLGLAILRGTMLEERMAGNMYERSLAFQAAESALREAELIASASPAAPAANCNAAGVCAEPDPALTERWLDPAFTGWVNAPLLASASPAPPPGSYFIEYMGLSPTWPGCDRKVPVDALCMAPSYRVTARSTAADRATVILQSNFVVQ
jgi:type IV pilus assembly protein PilX